MAAELIALGYRVVGVDASAAMLARAPTPARARGGAPAPGTLPDLTVDGVFDAAVSHLRRAQLPHARRAPRDAAGGRRPAAPRRLARLRPAHGRDDGLHRRQPGRGRRGGRPCASRSRSLVDPGARTCDTRIDVTRIGDGDTFTELHRQYFHSDDAGPGCTRATRASRCSPSPRSTPTSRSTSRRCARPGPRGHDRCCVVPPKRAEPPRS